MKYNLAVDFGIYYCYYFKIFLSKLDVISQELRIIVEAVIVYLEKQVLSFETLILCYAKIYIALILFIFGCKGP